MEREHILAWWIIVLFSIFLWYRNYLIDRVVSVYAAFLAVSQLFLYTSYNTTKDVSSYIHATCLLGSIAVCIASFCILESRRLSESSREILKARESFRGDSISLQSRERAQNGDGQITAINPPGIVNPAYVFLTLAVLIGVIMLVLSTIWMWVNPSHYSNFLPVSYMVQACIIATSLLSLYLTEPTFRVYTLILATYSIIACSYILTRNANRDPGFPRALKDNNVVLATYLVVAGLFAAWLTPLVDINPEKKI